MNRGISKVNLFSRYNIAVFVLFVALLLIASAIAFYRYHFELEQQLTNEIVELGEQANIISNSLERSQQTLQGLQQFAEYSLTHPDDLFASAPLLVQEDDSFYLKVSQRGGVRQKKLRGNITGRGKVSEFSTDMWREITMANALTPAFVTGANNNPDATWFYYISLSRFINIYPWISRNAWRYSDSMLNESYLWQVRQDNLDGKRFVWSQPYHDTAGKGVKASIGTGVFFNQTFKGALVIDVDLASLQRKLPDVNSELHGYVLLNEQGSALVHKSLGEAELKINDKWQDIVPEALKSLSQIQLRNFADNLIYRDWLIQKYQLDINGWSLIKYQPYNDFNANLKNRFIFSILMFVVGLAAFLALVYVMTRKTFIKPASEFISHIEHCAEGDPGKIKPTIEWLPWFQLVENIFGQNRSLMQQLKEQNAALDSRVAEKTQALIERSEQHHRAYVLLRSVINGIPEFIIFNDSQNKLTGCNKSFEQYIGETEANMQGKEVTKLLPVPIQQMLLKFNDLPEEQTSLGYQQTIETSGDTFEVFCTRFYNESGSSLGSIVILRDVSVQFAVQSALQNAKEQAEQANKAKSQFLANMSHEIRTPINAIQGMMALMAKTSLSAFQQQYLANAQGASAALLHLIDELLDLSKIEAGKLRLNFGSAKLDGIVDRVLQLNTLNAYKKGLSLEVDIDAQVPELVNIDEMRLTQVLTNLVNNAIKFTHQGSVRLTINSTAQDDNNAILKFAVADSGIGIAKEKQALLFDAFNQADESMTREYGGSGLGLSISQQIVQLFGGEIKVNSSPDTGSEFSFVIPVRQVEKQIQNRVENITIVTLGCEFSKSLEASVSAYHWHYQAAESIAALEQLNISGDVVLLVDGDYLTNNDLSISSVEKVLNDIVLIGICQPIMTTISEKIVNQLPQLVAPYLLFDIPLYRFTLSKINQHLLLAATKETVSDTPQIANSKSEEKTEKPSPLAGSLKDVSVLLVEDNLVNQMVAQELLFSMGAQVIIAENGAVAIEQLTKNDVDVVLMDIQMPVMDGLTASKKIREQQLYADLPIIAMTAHARAEDKKASFDAGMNLHVAKPVSAEVLSASILKMLKQATVN
ncbi:response regulator [Thalassotalea sp. M1531]|uniref:Sensory/regulatory protein RpfC n=1 Tax=Thalassotalea algicola TaxID=2716224 RepID=A0A7Y0L994_9GAMM|nr:ATP-binding protein [Thalassotalea algicola]NMP30300.1 response regulator [Thalassotalea algicola]